MVLQKEKKWRERGRGRKISSLENRIQLERKKRMKRKEKGNLLNGQTANKEKGNTDSAHCLVTHSLCWRSKYVVPHSGGECWCGLVRGRGRRWGWHRRGSRSTRENIIPFPFHSTKAFFKPLVHRSPAGLDRQWIHIQEWQVTSTAALVVEVVMSVQELGALSNRRIGPSEWLPKWA